MKTDVIRKIGEWNLSVCSLNAQVEQKTKSSMSFIVIQPPNYEKLVVKISIHTLINQQVNK